MPVIQLPKDTRWGDLGTGLGTAITQIASAYGEREADKQVASIMEDPLLTEPAKLTKIMKEVPGGFDRYKGLLTTQVLQATIEEKKAEAEKNRAAAGVTQGRTAGYNELMGLPATPATPVRPASVAPVAPTPSTPTATPSVASVLESGAAPEAAPAGAAGAALSPPTATTTAPAPALTPAPSAPTGLGARVDELIDIRAKALGVTVSPAEKQSLRPSVAQRWLKGEDVAEPIDKFLKDKQTGAKFPSELAASQAGAETAAAGAATARAKGEVELEKSAQELRDLRTKAPYTGPKLAAETQTAQQTAAAGKPTGDSANDVMRSFPTFSAEQAQSVELAGRSGGPKGAVSEISRIVGENSKAAVGEGTAKFLREAASYGSITERFANEMAAAPDKLGLLGFSGIKARLEARGLPVGDTIMVNLLNSQKLAVAEQARQSGQFGVSATNLKLSKDTAANIDKTAVSNVMMFAATAAQKLKEADVEKALYANNPRALAAIDAAMQPWKNIQAITDTLTSYTAKDPDKPKAKERDVMYFMGNQVSPLTMAPLVRQDKTEYAVEPKGDDKNTSYTGEQLWALATAAGIDPALMLTRMGGTPGTPIKR